MTNDDKIPTVGKILIDQNHPIKKNTQIFSFIMIILQVCISVIYGILI